MIKKEVRFDFLEFESINDCTEEVQNLYKNAIEARENAYAPYSKFKVGAALLLENGEVILGNNQENAAYPAGLCAERVAIFSAKANFPQVAIKAIVIVTSAENIKEPVSPCGVCRQVLVEYENLQNQPFQIYLQSKNNRIIQIDSSKNLLPFSFHSDMLRA